MKRIRFLYSMPRSIAYGGQEHQAEQLVESVRLLRPEWDVSFLDYASKETTADIYHLVGNAEYMWGVARFLDPRSKFVISAIHGIRVDKIYHRNLKRIATRMCSWVGERTSYGNICSLFERADHISVLTNESGVFLTSRYGIPTHKVHTIPNGVSKKFFDIDGGGGDSVIILGSIIERKAALEAARFAASENGRRYKFHFIGGSLNNEKDYFNQFVKLTSSLPNVQYHGVIDQRSIDFDSILSRCGVFLQLSIEETQSLAALEAIAAGKACVFLDRPYSRVAPFSRWPRVNGFDSDEINAAIKNALQIRDSCDTRTGVLTWEQVGERMVSLYERV